MTRDKIKILFIGLGGIGQRHLRNVYTKFGNKADILAYRSRNFKYAISPNLKIDKDIDFIKKYSVEVFTDLNDALSTSPDVAFICNPTSLHVSSCITIAKAGCDFFVEKPLSNSLDNIDELMQICQSKNLICQIGLQIRFHPCFKLLKKLILHEAIGNIISAHAEVGAYLPDWHTYEDYRKLYASRYDLGGGVILTQIHEIDYLYDLFGMPNSVVAMGGHLSNLEIDTEDTADILLEFDFNKRSFPVSIHMDFLQKPPCRTCKIIGDKGRIIMDLNESITILEKLDNNKNIYNFNNFGRNELFVNEIDHFFYCVNNRQQPIMTLKDGINSLKIAMAIKESIKKRNIVNIIK